MSTVKNNNKKAAKSGKKVKKTYADVMGIGSVVHNEKVDFVVGLVLLYLPFS